jgi:hypothetical protein
MENRCFVVSSVSFVTTSANVGWSQELERVHALPPTPFVVYNFVIISPFCFQSMSVFIVRADPTFRSLCVPFSSATRFGSFDVGQDDRN